MGDIGWSPIDGWVSGPGIYPRRPSYRPDSGRVPHRFHGSVGPPALMPPQRRPHPDFIPRGFGPPPRVQPSPGSNFGDLFEENRYDSSLSKFRRGPPPRSTDFVPRDLVDMFGGLGLNGGSSNSGCPRINPSSHSIDRDGARRLSETPVVFPLSSSGKKVHCIVDTGASITLIRRSALRRYFPGIAVTRGVEITMSGVSEKGDVTDERVMLTLTFVGERKELIRARGEAWVVEGKHLDTDILLGLPFMRDNGMHLQWGSGAGSRSKGDHISCRGMRIPIDIDSKG